MSGYKACRRAFRPHSSQHTQRPRLGEQELLVLQLLLSGQLGTGELVLVKRLLRRADRVVANVTLVATELMLSLQVASHVVSFVSDMLTQAAS